MSEPANPNRVVQIRELARKLCEATSGPPDSFLFWPAPGGTLGALFPWDPAAGLPDIERSLADRRPRQFPAWTFFTSPAAGIIAVAALEAVTPGTERAPKEDPAPPVDLPIGQMEKRSGLVACLQEAFNVRSSHGGYAYIAEEYQAGAWIPAPEARGPNGERVEWRPRRAANPGIIIRLVGEGEVP